MTEELKQEAEEYTKNLLKKLGIKEDMLLENQPKYLRQESMNFVALDVENVTDAYLASAEPREKQITGLSKHTLELQKDKGNLIDRCKELEAQIEKMKNWCNCKNYWFCLEECCRKNISFEKGICYNCKKWEIKENGNG